MRLFELAFSGRSDVQFGLELHGLPRLLFSTAVSHAVTTAVHDIAVSAGLFNVKAAIVSARGLVRESSSTSLMIAVILPPGSNASAASVILTSLADNVGDIIVVCKHYEQSEH